MLILEFDVEKQTFMWTGESRLKFSDYLKGGNTGKLAFGNSTETWAASIIDGKQTLEAIHEGDCVGVHADSMLGNLFLLADAQSFWTEIGYASVNEPDCVITFRGQDTPMSYQEYLTTHGANSLDWLAGVSGQILYLQAHGNESVNLAPIGCVYVRNH